MNFPLQNIYSLPKREMEDYSSFPLTSSETDFPPFTLFQCLCNYALKSVYITETVFLREIGAERRFWELHSAWAREFQGGFSLVLKANIIGTQLIPEGCGGLSNFLQEFDWKLLWNSQFSVWPVLPWALLAAWLSNVVIHLFTKSLEQLLSVVIQKQIPIYYHRCWGGEGKIGRYLEDETWGRTPVLEALRVKQYDGGSCFGGG